MRPLHETTAHLLRERQAMLRMEELKPEFTFRKIPGPGAPLDAFVTNREVRAVAMAEIKCRNYSVTRFPDLILSLAKVERGWTMCSRAFLPFLLVAAWTDALGYHWMNRPEAYEIRWAGRRDRGEEDLGDVELCVCIPVGMFRLEAL